MAQAMAAAFVEKGEHSAAIMISVAHDCILRTSEFMELRTTDVISGKEGMLLTLRDTKIGQRLGVQQDVLLTSPWLVARVEALKSRTKPGMPLMNCLPSQFRRVWARARRRWCLPMEYAPYGLRRGGATTLFQSTGSFDRVADKGRWLSAQAVRIYVATALQEQAARDFSDLSTVWTNMASVLRIFS